MSDAVKRVFFGKGSDSLQVEGQDDLLVYRARCCNPIRGEEIIGYVTRGKGVAVHARSCPNVQNLLYESDRRIQVEWAPISQPTRRRRRTQAPDLPSQTHHPLRRPRRPAQGVHRHHLRRRHQHPLLRLQCQCRRRRRHRLRHRNRRRPPPQSPRRQTPPRPGRPRHPARPENLARPSRHESHFSTRITPIDAGLRCAEASVRPWISALFLE